MTTGLKDKVEINFETTNLQPTEAVVTRNDFVHVDAINAIGVAELKPVIGLGAHSGDYHGSADPNAPEQHVINVPLPPGARVIGAWYAPLHNIAALPDFALIDVVPQGATQISLAVAGYAGRNTQMRIKISVMYAAG